MSGDSADEILRVIHAARMVTYSIDCRRKTIQRSANSFRLLGLPQEGQLGSWCERIVPETRASFELTLEGLKPGLEAFELKYRFLNPNLGQLQWILDRGEAQFDQCGEPVAINGVLIDISTCTNRDGNLALRQDGVHSQSLSVMTDDSERRKAEEAAARLAAIVESSDDAIISKTLNGIITSWNSGAERLFGYAAEEIIGESVLRILPLHGDKEENQILDTIGRGEAVLPFESQRLHKSGLPIHVSVTVSPIRNSQGIVVGASTIARDATERRRNIEALRENESRLRLALHSARAGVWDFDFRSRQLHWSPEMYSLYGLNQADGKPRREDLIRQIAPHSRKRAQLEFFRALRKGGSFTLEFPVIRPDGSEVWTALSGDVIKNAAGRPVSARGIDQDITERKNWEKRQAILLRELSHRVKNTLAVIQSVARQTLRSSYSPQDFVESFEGRVGSLAASHNLLTEANWSGTKLDVIIRRQTAVMAASFDRQMNLSGPDIELRAELSTQLGLVIHELATNAAKFGALSVPEGRVDVVWRLRNKRLKLIWRERDGPSIISKPVRSGFGTALLRSSVLRVNCRFARKGLVCTLELAL
jgi:PAS domain S-box-containing protein